MPEVSDQALWHCFPNTTINDSIIHGSALNPVEYVLTASGLHPTSPLNKLCKYADDTYLLVPTLHPYHQRFSTYQTGLQLIT